MYTIFFMKIILFYKYQSGFLPGHSTTYQLVFIFHLICQSFEEKQTLCIIFVIYRKHLIVFGIMDFSLNCVKMI